MSRLSGKKIGLMAVMAIALLVVSSLAVAKMATDVQAKGLAGAYTPDEMLVVLGFRVEITGAGSGGDVDSAWETMAGGSLNIEIADASVGTDQPHVTTPGHKYVEEVTLRGPLTASAKDTGNGSPNRGRGLAGVDEGSYEILENGAGKFKIDIQGAPTASANVESITMEDLTIDVREMSTGADWDYRVFGPGDAHFGSITIRSRVGNNSKELYQWWLDTSRGRNIRKQISVVALRRDGAEARSYNFLECFPTRYQPLVLDGTSRISVEEITAKCEGVDMEVDGNRKALVQWITETVQGKDWKRNVTITEITKDGSDGKSYTYIDAFPTRYVFPAFSSSGTGNLYEEISLKPIRLELS